MFNDPLTDRKLSFIHNINLYREPHEKLRLEIIPLNCVNDPLNQLIVGNLSNRPRIQRQVQLQLKHLNQLHLETRKRSIRSKFKKRNSKLCLSSDIETSVNINNDFKDLYSIDFNINSHIKYEPKVKDTTNLYNIHDELTDKKILGTITHEEEAQLEKIRNKLEFYPDEKKFIDLYEDKIDKYQELLEQIKDLKKIIKEK